MLFRGFGSQFCEIAAASTRARPAALALTVTANCAESPLASPVRVQVNTLAWTAQSEVHDTSDSAGGSPTPASTVLAVAWPGVGHGERAGAGVADGHLAGQDNAAETVGVGAMMPWSR